LPGSAGAVGSARPSRLLVFDSGLGGLSVVRALRDALPEATIRYLADDAGFPYGDLSGDVLAERVAAIVGAAIADDPPDAVVIACNTASTVALPVLRARHSIPFVGTIPAVKPAAALSRSGLVSVLATPATVARDYTRALIAEHGRGCSFTLVGAPSLAALVEHAMAGGDVPDSTISAAIAPCFVEADGARTDVIVLACTHYPLLIERLEALAPWPVTWLDPAPAIARRTANVLASAGFVVGVGASRVTGTATFTSGRAADPTLAAVLARYGLRSVASA
jgi:glutamate racemase